MVIEKSVVREGVCLAGEKRRLRVALLGSEGMLARKVRQNAPAWTDVTGFDLPECDITDLASCRRLLMPLKPDFIINCAAFTAVDACEEREADALEVNGRAVGGLADLAEQVGAYLLHLSTDYVFDGRQERPYREIDPTNPLSAYGRTKLAGEKALAEAKLARYLIVRTSWLYGPGGRNFVKTILRLAADREELRIVADQVGSPTYTGDLADALFALIRTIANHEQAGRQGPSGICHFSNDGVVSWCGFAERILALARAQGHALQARRVTPITTEDYPLPAPRPAYSVLATRHFQNLTGSPVPGWQDGLQTYLAEVWDETDIRAV